MAVVVAVVGTVAASTAIPEAIGDRVVALIQGIGGGDARGGRDDGRGGSFEARAPADASRRAFPADQGDVPAPPPAPVPDDGAGEHGSEDADLVDRAKEQLFYGVADAAELRGFTDAARHMRHYLDNSGEPLDVSPEAMLRDVPSFDTGLRANLATMLGRIQAEAVDRYARGETGAFDTSTPWFNATAPTNSNWYYALGTWSYAVTSRTSFLPPAEPGGRPRLQVRYRVHVYDRYNWDKGKAVTIAGKTVSDEELQELHRAGLAQEYDVNGSTDEQTTTLDLPAAPPQTPIPPDEVPDSPSAGREGQRSDPGRERD